MGWDKIFSKKIKSKMNKKIGMDNSQKETLIQFQPRPPRGQNFSQPPKETMTMTGMEWDVSKFGPADLKVNMNAEGDKILVSGKHRVDGGE